MIILGITAEAMAETWTFLPKEEQGLNQKGIALIWGSHEFDRHDNYSGDTLVEISMPCKLLKASKRSIRQQISLTNYDHHQDHLITLALNPHYIFQFADQFQLGVGPAFQLAYVDADKTSKDTIFGFGVGGSLQKDFTNKIFFGMEMDYTWMNDADFHNFKAIGKVGYRVEKWRDIFQ